MSCGCASRDIRHSVKPKRWSGWFTIGPYEDLGERFDVAAKAIGWRPPALMLPAHGFVWVRNGEFVRSFTVDNLDLVRRMAGAAAVESHTPIGIGEVCGIVGDRVLCHKIEIVEPVPFEELLFDADRAVRDIVSDLFKASEIINPATASGRSLLIRQVADAMVAKIRPWERSATAAGNKFLEANWTDLTSAQRRNLIRAASKRIRAVPVRGIKGINKTISTDGKRIMVGARRNAIDKFKLNINANLTSPDRAALAASERTAVRWLTNEYGSRADAFEGAAQRVVQRGLAEGLGRGEISRDLRQVLGQKMTGRTESYFRVFAGALVDRSRTRAELNSYREAQITRYIADAVLDEATTEFCRWVDGRVFDVETSIGIMDRADKEGLSVEAMKEANPWVRHVKGDNGQTSVQANGVEIFKVTNPGMGTQSPGEYVDGPGAKDLSAQGIGPPPYHGNCRTTTVADVSTKRAS